MILRRSTEMEQKSNEIDDIKIYMTSSNRRSHIKKNNETEVSTSNSAGSGNQLEKKGHKEEKKQGACRTTKQEKKKEKSRKAVIGFLAVVAAGIVCVVGTGFTKNKYETAYQLYDQGEYHQAMEILESIPMVGVLNPGFQNEVTKCTAQCLIQIGTESYKSENFGEAFEMTRKLFELDTSVDKGAFLKEFSSSYLAYVEKQCKRGNYDKMYAEIEKFKYQAPVSERGEFLASLYVDGLAVLIEDRYRVEDLDAACMLAEMLKSCSTSTEESVRCLKNFRTQMRNRTPENGIVNKTFGDGEAELVVEAPSDEDVYLKLQDITDKNKYAMVYVRAGMNKKINMPDGEYVLKYTSGSFYDWRDTDKMFGENAPFVEANGTLEFNSTGYYTTSMRISLTKVSWGNIGTRSISAGDF